MGCGSASRARSARRTSSLNLAVSGTGTSGMEAAVANLTKPGARALVVVTGYFGDRLAQMLERYGATVTRVQVEWGRACDPVAGGTCARPSLPTSWRSCMAKRRPVSSIPVHEIAAIAQARGALTIVDAVTTLGGVPLTTGQSGHRRLLQLHAEGIGRAVRSRARSRSRARALEQRVPSRSFYLDLGLLEDFWVRRKYHHTISAPLVYALHEALTVVQEEGLDARWERHRAPPPSARGRPRSARPLAAAATGRTSVDAERRARARRR